MAFWKKKDNSQFSWRPFQIGFFLLNLESLINQNSEDRDFFDLLWFPTGGGKTEAYLFISIFLIFYSRLDKNFHNTSGTQIIMRYTLRVLTVDQFNRISAIICADNFSVFMLGIFIFGNITLFYHDALDGDIVYNHILGKIYDGNFDSIKSFLGGQIEIEYLRRLFFPISSLYALFTTEVAYWTTDIIVKITSYFSF